MKIISGGQTGADQAGLGAALLLGLETGGWAPRGWRTDAGPEPRLADLGLVEHESSSYAPRTGANVAEADGTLIFGNPESPGCRLTRKFARQAGSPLFVQRWALGDPGRPSPAAFQRWLKHEGVRVLNVAGNRERINPGIFFACRTFIVEALRSSGR